MLFFFNNANHDFLLYTLIEFFNTNTKFREYFDDIFYLNGEIVKREKEIKKLRNDEMESFRKENAKRVGNV